MVKTAKTQSIKNGKHQSKTPMRAVGLPLTSGLQKQGIKKLKNELQKQTNDFLKNQSPQSPPLVKQASPSPIISPSASSLSSYAVIVSQVQSQTKSENLRKQILELEQELQQIEDTQSNTTYNPMKYEINDEHHGRKDGVNDANLDMELCSHNQLFGKNWKEDEMDLLCYEIYCKKSIRAMAECCSYKASHVARRLLEGVYKRESLVKYTFTGKSQGKFCGTLDQSPKNAIIEFSMNLNKNQVWKSQTIYDINRAMSQKVSEIKRAHKRL